MHFEKVKRFENEDIKLPVRATASSAGYDFYVAEDTIIPPYDQLMESLLNAEDENLKHIVRQIPSQNNSLYLAEMAEITKKYAAKPTLVSTGVKAIIDSDKYLELSVRSSCPLKYWLVLANGVGIIDADYANNPSNDGEIFFQLINFSPYPIHLCKGDCIGQGIIKPYFKVDEDNVTKIRQGGFGSNG